MGGAPGWGWRAGPRSSGGAPPGGRSFLARLNGEAARAWKLDYLVTPRGHAEDDPYVLRIWCHTGEGSFRPYGAERVARILAPAVEEWVRARGSAEAALVERVQCGMDVSGVKLGEVSIPA